MTQTEGCAADLGRCNVGDKRIAGRAANALADAVRESRAEHLERGHRERKDRLGQGAQAIARHRQPFAVAKAVAEPAGENPGDRRRGLGDAF